MYYFLPFGFINVINFANNPSGFYSTLVGAEMLSTPFRQVTIGVAAQSWANSISNQFENCDGVVLEIYTNSNDLSSWVRYWGPVTKFQVIKFDFVFHFFKV